MLDRIKNHPIGVMIIVCGMAISGTITTATWFYERHIENLRGKYEFEIAKLKFELGKESSESKQKTNHELEKMNGFISTKKLKEPTKNSFQQIDWELLRLIGKGTFSDLERIYGKVSFTFITPDTGSKLAEPKLTGVAVYRSGIHFTLLDNTINEISFVKANKDNAGYEKYILPNLKIGMTAKEIERYYSSPIKYNFEKGFCNDAVYTFSGYENDYIITVRYNENSVLNMSSESEAISIKKRNPKYSDG